MRVYTNIKTLAKVERLLAELGVLDALYGKDSGGKEKVGLDGLLQGLLHGGKLQELMEIITRDSDTDFEEMELSQVREILSSFFTGILAFLPDVMRANVERAFQMAGRENAEMPF